MRRTWKNILGGAVALALLTVAFGSSAFASAAVVEAGRAPGAATSETAPDAAVTKEKEYTQMITVAGSGMDSSHVQVTYYKKDSEGQWAEQFSVPGYCGHNGMSYDKKEGDRKTPIGTYSFTTAFGVYADPGSVIPYKVLDQNDYWVDDSSSQFYNQMVNTKTTAKTWNSAEHLIGVLPQYHYALALNYNTENPVPGKGSAIFLHGYHTYKTWTEGCIAIPEEKMKLLLQNVDTDTQIVIAPDQGTLSTMLTGNLAL